MPIQKLEKMTPSRSSDENSPVMLLSAFCARRSSSANRSSAGPRASNWAAASSTVTLYRFDSNPDDLDALEALIDY